MKVLQKILTVFLFLLSFCVSLQAQESENYGIWNNGVFRSYWLFGNIPQNEILKIKKRWDEIGESFKTTSNSFSGTYYQAGNRGYYLRWSPEKGFVYSYYYEDFVVDASYGKVLVTSSDIKFIPEREMKNSDVSRKLVTSSDWIPAFDEQQYLVRKKDIKSFGDFYGGFGDFNGFPRKWNCDCAAFAVRIDKNVDYSKIKSFIVPQEYLPFIKQPITAKVIFVGKSRIATHPLVFDPDTNFKASITPVRINIGKKSGIKRGLLFVTDKDDSFFEVKKVGQKTSSAILVRGVNKNGNEAFYDGWDNVTDKLIYKPYRPLRIGTIITTKNQ